MAPVELAPGDVFAGYRVEAIAGRGGMGIVYRATQVALGRPVALKLIAAELAQDAGFRERFERESRVAASIDHPHVIPVYEAGEHDGLLFIAMRFVEGTELGALIAREGPLEPRRAARVVAQVAAALDAAHQRGLVHRDVKPANVLIADWQDHAYLSDFGLTKRMTSDSGPTRTGQWVGTLDYVAPEQIQAAPLDPRTDVYALACVLYKALSGRVPFERETDAAKLWAHLNDPPPPLPAGLPSGLQDVIAHGMAKAPGDRYPSAGQLGAAAVAGAEGPPPAATAAAPPPTVAAQPPRTPATPQTAVAAAPTEPGTPPPRARSRRRWLIVGGVAGVLAVALVVLLAAGVFGGDDDGGGTDTNAATPTPTPSATASPTATATETTSTSTDGTPASAEAAERVVRRFIDRYQAGDASGVAAILTDDVVFQFESGLTGEETKRGQAVRDNFESVFAQDDTTDYRGTIEGTERSGDATTVRIRWSEAIGPVQTSGTTRFDVVDAGGRALIRELRTKATP